MMRVILTLFFTGFVAHADDAVIKFVLPAPPDFNVDREVDVLRLVEHWDGHTRGAAGEWGHWQFTPPLWRSLSRQPQRTASVGEQRQAAKRHVLWIVQQLPSLNLPKTAYSVGLVWAAGYKNVAAGRIWRSKIEYANRVRNLYDDPSSGPASEKNDPVPQFRIASS